MKKLLSILLAAIMIFCFAACGKENSKQPGPGCYVTISDKGQLVASAMFVEFPNEDKNNVDDVLKATFKSLGKEADYASAPSDYGLSITKLCGDESMAFSYYVNNQGAMSLEDEVKENDYVVAYVFQDQAAWSDAFSFFDKCRAEGTETELTLTASTYDANWNVVNAPFENAVITIDGAETQLKTDKDGKVTVKVEGTGEHIISAVSKDSVLVPPVCVITVK